MTRLLITAANYAPEPSGNAPYTAGLAEHLVSAGWDVTVVTTFPHYPGWRLDRRDARRLRAIETRNGVRVMRFRCAIPPRQSVIWRAAYEGTFFAHALAARLPRPDAVVGITPNLAGAALARVFAARFRTRYGVVVQDTMGRAAAQSGLRSGARVSASVTQLEGWALGRAHSVAVASDSFAPYLESIGVPASRITPVQNWSLMTRSCLPRDAARAQFGWGSEYVALHAGNMGMKQGLEQILAAARLAATCAPDVLFVLLGDGNQRATLQAIARDLPNVRFIGGQDGERYMAALHAADVLLISERSSVADMSLPSKLTAYCEAGRPVIAAVREDGATAREVTEKGVGLVAEVGRPEMLLDAIARLRADPALADSLAGAGLKGAATVLSRDAGLSRAREFVENLTSKPSVA